MGIHQIKCTVLETERLYLRELSQDVYNQLFTTCSDAEISEYMGFETATELAEEKAKFQKGLETYFISFRNFLLVDKNTDEVLGRCGYHTWFPTHRRAEVGYYLFKDKHKGKGYMTEALGAVICHGFEKMNLYRIEALLSADNLPSKKLLQRYGFQEEGTVRGHYVVNGVNEDSLLVSLLLPEYEQLKSSWGLQEKVKTHS